jgi:hypothetical protein
MLQWGSRADVQMYPWRRNVTSSECSHFGRRYQRAPRRQLRSSVVGCSLTHSQTLVFLPMAGRCEPWPFLYAMHFTLRTIRTRS